MSCRLVIWKNVVFLSLTLPSALAISQTVHTKYFDIQGDLSKTASGKFVYSYLGVPFARPPVDRLRFRPPRPITRWKGGLLDGSQLAKTCYSATDSTFPGFAGSEMWNPPTEIAEDCLYLNIWVPAYLDDDVKLPVVVWIFGGGFYSGSPSLDLYNGAILAVENNVVVVNINYRLGPFGFLYLGEGSSAEGNMGLLDQQMALKWIQENIKSFAGDPDDVNIFGESAGAASVSSHLLAPGSANLFKKAFLQSGSILNKWAHTSPEIMLQRSRRLAQLVGCDADKPARQIAACLRGRSARDLNGAMGKINEGELRFLEFAFVPIAVDGNFFPKNVTVSLSRGDFKKRQVIMGTVAEESTFWLPYYLPNIIKFDPDLPKRKQDSLLTRSEYLQAVNQTFQNYFPSILKKSIAFHYSDELKIAAIGERRSSGFRDGVTRMIADFFFDCDLLNFAQTLAEHGSDVYLYQFAQRSTANPWPVWMGTMHGYEIEYFFGVPLRNPKEYTKTEVNFSKKMMKLWTNFVRNGFPSADGIDTPWPLYGSEERKYLVLNAKNSTVLSDLNLSNCHFWNDAISANKKIENENNWISSAADMNLATTWMSLVAILYVHFYFLSCYTATSE